MSKNKHARPIRHATERVLNFLLLGGTVAGLSYRLGGQGRVRVVRQDVDVKGGKRLARPLRIGFASDFHAGPTTHDALFDDLLRQIEQERPDVLLLGGDYVSFDAANARHLAAFLRQAHGLAPLGAYAVMGNHDVWNGREPIERVLRDSGVTVLVNRSIPLPAPFGEVSICGIDDPWTGRPSARDTFAGAGPVRIYLMHSPDGLWRLEGQHFDVGFAGHTHGGQIALQNGAPLFRPSGPVSRDYCYGRYDVPGNGPLIVSRGVGCAGIPLRLNADPELLICTLR
ncbi:metallophosphoesterase [Massilia sp. TN1-12]|uniref:metallophosphoesterase n=1 Tax=Massilia paldalensis TaxID=3377675 RepID=UPI003850273E